MLKLDLTIKEMLDILESQAYGLKPKDLFRKVKLSMDSRENVKGCVFWPIKGIHFDAHQFVNQMEKEGVLMSVMNQEAVENFSALNQMVKAYTPVEDTTKALLKLAKGYQRLFKVKKIAITGSNGKTTTKEMTKAVLSSAFVTHATEGNFNNHIGVPKTLFQLKHKHEMAVVEMGTSGPNEIRPLSLATEPDVAIITCIGASHLERLVNLDGVFKEKINITAGLKKGGFLIVNADDERLCKVKNTKNYKVITFGVRRGMIKPEKLIWNDNACADFYIGRTHFKLNVSGIHNLYNALAAIAVGEIFRVPKSKIAKALENFRATHMRMEVKKVGGLKIVSDCYNANPSSTKMALQTIGNMNVEGSRIAVLGDMLELGKESGKLHKAIGAFVSEMNFDLLACIGEEAKNYVIGAKERGMKQVFHFESINELNDFLKDVVAPHDVILVKGSRGMKMEQVVDSLCQLTATSKI